MIKGTDSLCLWCACSHLGESLELASALGSSCPSWGVCRVKVTIWASHAYWQWIGTVRLSLTESVRPLFQIILPLKFTLVSPVTIMHITASTPASDICIWSEPTPSLDFCYMWNVSGAKTSVWECKEPYSVPRPTGLRQTYSEGSVINMLLLSTCI